MKKTIFFLFFLFCSCSLFCKPPAIIMVGPPGAGKTTQSKLITNNFSFVHISTGEILRNQLKKDSILEKTIEKGDLISDNFILNILWERLKNKDCLNGFIIDGSSRNLNQAQQLVNHLSQKYHLIFIIFQVSDETIIQRLKNRLYCKNCYVTYHSIDSPPKIEKKCDYCNESLLTREDDSEEIILKRLKIFHLNNKELNKFYSNYNHVYFLDADRAIEIIFRDLCNILLNAAILK